MYAIRSYYGYEDALAEFFTRLRGLNESEPQVMLSMVQGHHPVRKMAQKVIALRRQHPEKDFDLEALSLLMRTILQRNYEYWLSEEDPLPWFEKECNEYCEQWHGQSLLIGISHARIRECRRMLSSIDFAADYQGALEKILTLPNHMDLVRLYKEIPTKMSYNFV